MEISAEIKDALERAIEYYGNIARLAEECDLHYSTVFLWVTGRTKRISGRIWAGNVRPILQRFMAPDSSLQRSALTIGAGEAAREPVPEYAGYRGSQETAAEERPVPMISFRMLMEFNPTITSWKRFVNSHQLLGGHFSACICKRNAECFAVRLSTEFPGVFLPGTDILLAPGEYPKNGDCVLVRLHENHEVLFARFQRNGNLITLFDIRSGQVLKKWDCTVSLGYTIWMYPVLEAKRDFSEGMDIYHE